MKELVDELRRRFPLFERIVGHFGDDRNQESIPWFFALLAAAAMHPHAGSYCFVLQKTPGTTSVAAVLCAIFRLFERSDDLIQEYAQTAVPLGCHVRVRPSNFIYKYGGIWEDKEGLFKLIKLDDPTSVRSYPVADILRLEPTDRVRPRGDTNSPITQADRTPLDRLLGLTTCGNNAWMRNSVLLHMPQSRFIEVLDSVSIAPLQVADSEPLSAYLPWGGIGHEGDLLRSDPHQIAGEPPIAVTRVPQDLAGAALSAPCHTKIVFVDGARAAVREPQVFDEISDQQKVVIIASPDESGAIGLLKSRGCPVWYMSPDEIQLGETTAKRRSKDSIVGRTVANARIQEALNVRIISCRDDKIEAVAAALKEAAMAILCADESHDGEEIIARLYGILCECSECCFGVHRDMRGNLKVAGDMLDQYIKWLGPEVATPLCAAIRALRDIVEEDSVGGEKADELMRIIDEVHRGGTVWALAARSPRTAEHLRAWLDGGGSNLRVLPIPAISVNDFFDGVIVPGWPNVRQFSRLTSLAVTSDMRVVAYPFELGWLQNHRAREHAYRRSNRMDRKTRSLILGVDPKLLAGLETHPAAPDRDLVEDPIIRVERRVSARRIRPRLASRYEESREAQVVHFVGNCYALLTKWAKLPVLNHLFGTGGGPGRKIEYAGGNRLGPGDFVLFRAGSDKEFTRLIAEETLGDETYNSIRRIAEGWKPALQLIGSDAAVVRRRLAELGLSRTIATISAWLSDPDRIAPSHAADIDIIAKAAHDDALLRSRPEIAVAITRIRGAHVRAGNQLTDLIVGELRGRMDQVGEEPLLLHLAYGDAWVVQVDNVDPRRGQYPASLVNRLLSSDGAVT